MALFFYSLAICGGVNNVACRINANWTDLANADKCGMGECLYMLIEKYWMSYIFPAL